MIMKKIGFWLLTIFVIVLASCEKEGYVNLGFDSLIEENSKGLVIAHISDADEQFYLNGVIQLQKGELDVYLVNPDGLIVYSKTIASPEKLEINQGFDAQSGYWKLRYVSRDGLGEINLHLYK